MLPETFAENAAAPFLYAMSILIASCALAFFTNFLIGVILNQIVKRHDSPLRSIQIQILGALRIPVILIIILQGIRLSLFYLSHASVPSLGFLNELGELGHNIWLIAMALIACYTVSRLIKSMMRWYSARVSHDTRNALNNVIWPILIRITSIVVFTLGALVVLDIMGIPITPLLAGIGIGGLAVALALSPTISSFIAGTYVVAEGHISEGDYVEIDSERAGFVTDVGWRSTVLRSRFNNVIVVPNSILTESIVTNYATPTPAVTGIVECGVSYESDLKQVEQVSIEIAKAAIEESENGNKEFEPLFRFYEFGDSNINFRIIFQGADRPAMIAIQHEIIMRLHARFNEEGIEINYPVRKLTTELSNESLSILTNKNDSHPIAAAEEIAIAAASESATTTDGRNS